MNPAPSQYSLYHLYLLNSRKNDNLYNGLKNLEYKEGAG